MKLSCLREKLIHAIGIVSRVVGTKISLPILSNILISTDKGRLKFSATDLELGINTWIGAKIDKTGSITAPTRLFSEFINSIIDNKINFQVSQKQIIISSRTGKTTIKGLDAADFPSIPEIKQPICQLSIDPQTLKKALEKTVGSCAIDETKPVLAGIFFKVEANQIILASTDSYRLAETIINIKNKINKQISFIIPKRTANELIRIIDNSKEKIEIKISNNQASWQIADTYLITRLIEGNFPDYKQIIPQKFKTICEINKDELYQNLKTASLFSRDSANNVTITIDNNKVTINSSSSQLGENQSQLSAKKLQGDKIKFSINANYLLEILTIIKKPIIELKTVDKNSPIFIRPLSSKNCFFLIMPLKQE